MKWFQWANLAHPAGSVGSAVAQFLHNRLGRGLSPHTVSRLFYNLRPFAEAFGDVPFGEVSATAVRDYQRGLWRRYAPDTVRTVTGDIKQLCKWSKKRGLIGSNPARRLKGVRSRPGRFRRARAAEEGAVQATISYLAGQLRPYTQRDFFGNLMALEGCDSRAVRDLFALIFLYESGARVGELVELGSITLAHAFRVRSDVYQITMDGKTYDRDRWVTQASADLWGLWCQVRPGGAGEYAIVGWRVTSREATPISSAGVTRMLKRRGREAGVALFGSQALRHAKVKRVRSVGGLELARVLVDHSRIDTTADYDWGAGGEMGAAVVATGVHDLGL